MRRIVGVMVVLAAAGLGFLAFEEVPSLVRADTGNDPVVAEFMAALEVQEKYEIRLVSGLDASRGIMEQTGMPDAMKKKMAETQKKIRALVLA